MLPIKQIKQIRKEELESTSKSIVKVEVVYYIPSVSVTAAELQEKRIVNIGKTFVKNNEKAIIFCLSKPEKKRSSESNGKSKRTPSPSTKSFYTTECTSINNGKMLFRKRFDENGSSSSSFTTNNIEKIKNSL